MIIVTGLFLLLVFTPIAYHDSISYHHNANQGVFWGQYNIFITEKKQNIQIKQGRSTVPHLHWLCQWLCCGVKHHLHCLITSATGLVFYLLGHWPNTIQWSSHTTHIYDIYNLWCHHWHVLSRYNGKREILALCLPVCLCICAESRGRYFWSRCQLVASSDTTLYLVWSNYTEMSEERKGRYPLHLVAGFHTTCCAGNPPGNCFALN